MKTHQDLKSATYIEAMIPYAETLLEIRFKNVKKNRYNAPCPFHADFEGGFMAYVNKKNEVRFHCFGACKGDWDIYDLIMLEKNHGFRKAQQVWAEQLGVEEFRLSEGRSPSIPEPDEMPAPDDSVVFADPKNLDEKSVASLQDAAGFYNELLISNEGRFRRIRDYLARRGIGKDAIRNFTIGYAPPYSDEEHQGRALVTSLLPRFEKDHGDFDAFSDTGLIRLLNDKTAKEYGYYRRQIDFRRKNSFSRNYGDYFAGKVVFPDFDMDARPTGLVGRGTEDRGVRWLKHQTREAPLSARSRLYGIEKAKQYIRQYRTIILVEGLFDYFAFYNLLQDQDKPVVVSTLGSYLTPETATVLKSIGIDHFIVAYDWDELGRNGIERMASQSDGWVYFLGGPAEGQDPYDLLKPVAEAIGGFSLTPPKTRGPVSRKGD